MLEGKRIAVVVPAYNEEKLIGRTIDTIPVYIDTIVVVDDSSQDDSVLHVNERRANHPDRIVLIQHAANRGVGGAIASGYKWCRDHGIDGLEDFRKRRQFFHGGLLGQPDFFFQTVRQTPNHFGLSTVD